MFGLLRDPCWKQLGSNLLRTQVGNTPRREDDHESCMTLRKSRRARLQIFSFRIFKGKRRGKMAPVAYSCCGAPKILKWLRLGLWTFQPPTWKMKRRFFKNWQRDTLPNEVFGDAIFTFETLPGSDRSLYVPIIPYCTRTY